MLVAKAKSGHDDAFGELYKRHQRKSYCTALRILRNQEDAEDAVMRAFQRAIVNLQWFREDSTFSTWLTQIVISEASMLLRQRRTREPLHENNLDAAQGDGGVEWGVLRSVEGGDPLIRGETHPSSEPLANHCEFESSHGKP